MDAAMANPNKPDLCIRTACEQSIRGPERLIGDLELTSFYVDGNNPTVVASFYLRTDSLLVEFGSKASVLFFGPTRLPHSHGDSPVLDCERNRCIVRHDPRAVRTVWLAAPWFVPPSDGKRRTGKSRNYE